MVAKALGEQGAVDSLASDLAKDGLLAVCEGGGDLGMAVPGLASFLAFLSRPQTPDSGGQAERGLLVFLYDFLKAAHRSQHTRTESQASFIFSGASTMYSTFQTSQGAFL